MTSRQSLFRAGASLRNGNAQDITPVHLTGGIPAAYHLIPETSTYTSRLPTAAEVAADPALDPDTPRLYIPTAELAIRRLAALYQVRLAAANPPLPEGERRMAARALSAGRLAAAARLSILPNEHYEDQVAPVAGTWVRNEAGDYVWTPAAGCDPQVTAQAVADAYQAQGGFPEVLDVSLGQAAIGLHVTTGVVVHATKGHHYVEPHKETSNAVLRQVFGADFQALQPLAPETVKDVMCHKLAHTVRSEVLVAFALDPDMPARLATFNLASAAVRLPARTDAERRISSFIATYDAVSPMFGDINVNVGTFRDDLAVEMQRVHTEYLAAANPAAKLAAETAARERLVSFEGTVSILYGMYLAMTEAEDEVTATLRRARGLRRLVQSHTAQVARGRAIYANGVAWRRDRIRAGTLPGVALYNGAEPDSLRPDASEGPMAQLAPVLAALGRGTA